MRLPLAAPHYHLCKPPSCTSPSTHMAQFPSSHHKCCHGLRGQLTDHRSTFLLATNWPYRALLCCLQAVEAQWHVHYTPIIKQIAIRICSGGCWPLLVASIAELEATNRHCPRHKPTGSKARSSHLPALLSQYQQLQKTTACSTSRRLSRITLACLAISISQRSLRCYASRNVPLGAK